MIYKRVAVGELSEVEYVGVRVAQGAGVGEITCGFVEWDELYDAVVHLIVAAEGAVTYSGEDSISKARVVKAVGEVRGMLYR